MIIHMNILGLTLRGLSPLILHLTMSWPIPTHSSFDDELAYPSSSTESIKPSSFNRHEILQSKVKGYRESTYWGEQHPTHDQVRQFSDDEFDRFIDEVELNDADVYWGATY